MRVAYGVSRDLPEWTGMTPEAVGVSLRQMGCDGVFLKTLEVEWVEALQAADLKVLASFGVFIDSENAAGESVWERMPASRPITAAGTPAPQQDWYRPLLPVHPDVRTRRLTQFEELVRRLPLDGVWLDFMRWPARWEQPHPQLYHSSFDAITLARFQADTGVELPAADAADPQRAANWLLSHAADAWFAWRCQQIAAFVAAVRERLHQHRPGARLGLFTVPWIDATTGTTQDGSEVTQPHIRIVGQDPTLLCAHADVLSPMVYHRLCSQPVGWVGAVTRRVREQTQAGDHTAQVWPVVEAIEPPDTYAAAEFAHACTTAEAAGDGLIVFKLDGLLADPAKIAAWRRA